MSSSKIYYNNKTKQSATETWLANCGLTTDDVRSIAGWLPLTTEEPSTPVNRYTEKTVPDGTPYLSPDGQHFIQRLKTEKLTDGILLSAALEKYKTVKLAELKQAYEEAITKGVIHSSVGFDIDAGTESISHIENLIKMMTYTDTKETEFCAADNSFHVVSTEDLTMMQYEVIDYVQQMQSIKWKLRKEIEASEDYDACSKIKIQFVDVK